MSLSPEQGPLVKSVLRMLTQVRDQKVIDLKAFAAGREHSAALQKSLPPPAPQFAASVVMTTPYVILQPGEQDWQKFLERTLPRVRAADPRPAYAQLMKYGLELHYWNEYIFEAYANYRSEMIFLCGLPDVPESRPNSAINS